MRFGLAVFLSILVCSHALAQLPTFEPPRAWKLADGKTVNASVLSYDGKTLALKLPNGQRWETTVDQVSPEDVTYLTEWVERQPIVMPAVVGVDPNTMKVEVVSEDERNGLYVYRTAHFEFESEGKFTTSLLRDVGRNFEATYELLKALPWGIQPEPAQGEYFRAKLFRTKERYREAGGPENSGGVYMSGKALFMVPFSSIGLKVVGQSYAKDDNYDTKTLVHELTHEMMHHWLDLLPPWVVEGTAEYTAVLPLSLGKFRLSAAKNGLKDYLDYLKRKTMDGIPEPYPLAELFNVTPQQWHVILVGNPRISGRLYFTSYLLVYYFMELEDKGDRKLFVKYFREVGAMRKQMDTFLKDFEEFKKLPGVEVNADGSFRYPSNLTPPKVPEPFTSNEAMVAYQKQMLQILLNGRTEAELMEEIRSAYKRLGVKL
jgi:hypothetical protein